MTTETQPEIDAASRAANDGTNATPATQEAPKFSEQQVNMATALIIQALTGDKNLYHVDDLIELGEFKPYGRDLIEHALVELHKREAITYLPPLVTIQAAGWKLALILTSRLADDKVGRLTDELTAHKEHAAREQLLISTIRAREAQVESVKGAMNTAKKRLEEAHEDLAAHCAGGVQTKHPDLQPGKPAETTEQTTREKGRSAFTQGQALTANTYQDGTPERDEWCVGWRLQRMAAGKEPVSGAKLALKAGSMEEVRLLDGELGASEKAPQVQDKTVMAFDRPHLVVDSVCLGDEENEESPRRFLLVPIYTKDEWQQLHEAKYGRAVEGFDQTADAKAMRTQGGPDCGRVVVEGRRKGVVGPMSDAITVETGDAGDDEPVVIEGADGDDKDGDD